MRFFQISTGNLFPWNTFITASYYFRDRFCGTQFEDSFENYFTLSFTLAQTIGKSAHVRDPRRKAYDSILSLSLLVSGLALTIKYCEKWSLERKVVYPLIIYSIVFVITTALVVSFMDRARFFRLTLACTWISGMCGSLLSAGLFGLAGEDASPLTQQTSQPPSTNHG